jgi:hypothetical protein
MNLENAIKQLQTQVKAITFLAKGLSVEQIQWKPRPEDWSVLEVLNHLLNEETLDFRYYLGQIFTPEEPWPKDTSQDWALKESENPRVLEKLIINIEFEREKSLAWLKSLTDPDWKKTIQFKWGSLSAGDLLASWLTHDILHLRQLVELRYELTKANSAPYDVTYAGKW